MRFDAILFDCDGVLVDSEPISLKIMQTMLAELGWQITEAECEKWFVGQSTKDDVEPGVALQPNGVDDGVKEGAKKNKQRRPDIERNPGSTYRKQRQCADDQ